MTVPFSDSIILRFPSQVVLGVVVIVVIIQVIVIIGILVPLPLL